MAAQASGTIYLLDTNAILEAVRTCTWNAITGGLTIETMESCQEECLRGDAFSSAYVVVSREELERCATIRSVEEVARADLLLRRGASALDEGEADVLAYALSRQGAVEFMVCSSDRAAIRFAVTHGLRDHLVSLEEFLRIVGAKAAPPLRSHFTAKWLSAERARALLGS